mgnify:CR=1 FL=1|tara:strand:- start:454 stop:1401 length:948 start_codon:yes stop_codon:yes gene_type:complete
MKYFEKKNIYIISYHYIKEKNNNDLCLLNYLDFSKFKNQINHFKKHFKILDNEEFCHIIKTKKIPNFVCILLTFDDGYKDHYKYAYPVLSENNISGIFYTPINSLLRKSILEVNKVQLLLSKKNPKKLIQIISKKLEKFDLNLTDLINKNFRKFKKYDSEDVMIIKSLLNNKYYKLLEDNIRSELLDNLFEEAFKMNEVQLMNEMYLSEKDLIEMDRMNMSFGIHGVSHTRLPLLSEKNIKWEINQSINTFKKLNIRTDFLSLCYPNGSFNDNVLKVIEETKIKFSCTTNIGSINYNNITNIHVLPRIDTNEIKI